MEPVKVGRRTRPRGWTFDLGVPEIVEPYTNAEVFEQYGRLRFGGEEAAKEWRGGYLPYRGLTGAAAARLLDVLPADCLRERQNSAPTVGTFLRSAVAHPGEVELIGYCIGPDRDDERFAVEGLVLRPDRESGHDFFIQTVDWWAEAPEHDERCECSELWTLVETTYGVDDAHCFPTEMGECREPWRADARRGWRLWWT